MRARAATVSAAIGQAPAQVLARDLGAHVDEHREVGRELAAEREAARPLLQDVQLLAHPVVPLQARVDRGRQGEVLAEHDLPLGQLLADHRADPCARGQLEEEVGLEDPVVPGAVELLRPHDPRAPGVRAVDLVDLPALAHQRLAKPVDHLDGELPGAVDAFEDDELSRGHVSTFPGRVEDTPGDGPGGGPCGDSPRHPGPRGHLGGARRGPSLDVVDVEMRVSGAVVHVPVEVREAGLHEEPLVTQQRLRSPVEEQASCPFA